MRRRPHEEGARRDEEKRGKNFTAANGEDLGRSRGRQQRRGVGGGAVGTLIERQAAAFSGRSIVARFHVGVELGLCRTHGDPLDTRRRADLDEIPAILVRPHGTTDRRRQRAEHHREDRDPGEEALAGALHEGCRAEIVADMWPYSNARHPAGLDLDQSFGNFAIIGAAPTRSCSQRTNSGKGIAREKWKP